MLAEMNVSKRNISSWDNMSACYNSSQSEKIWRGKTRSFRDEHENPLQNNPLPVQVVGVS